MKVSAQYAQEHFADILSAADNGEEVEIAHPNKPTLFLAPRLAATPPRRARRELLGAWEHLHLALSTDEEWKSDGQGD